MSFRIKRVYEPATKDDGCRVLVDRLWPRGVSKERAALDEWCKDISPSPDLRKWFGHQPGRFAEFTKRYQKELEEDPVRQDAAAKLRKLAEKGTVTLLYGAKDPAVNHAIVLKRYLEKTM